MDSAFKIGTKEYLVEYFQEDPFDERVLLLDRQATSILQLRKWGMRIIEGSFSRLKDTLMFEEMGDRKVILQLMVHLYNFQTAQVGINQIMNSYRDKTRHFGDEAIIVNVSIILYSV